MTVARTSDETKYKKKGRNNVDPYTDPTKKRARDKIAGLLKKDAMFTLQKDKKGRVILLMFKKTCKDNGLLSNRIEGESYGDVITELKGLLPN